MAPLRVYVLLILVGMTAFAGCIAAEHPPAPVKEDQALGEQPRICSTSSGSQSGGRTVTGRATEVDRFEFEADHDTLRVNGMLKPSGTLGQTRLQVTAPDGTVVFKLDSDATKVSAGTNEVPDPQEGTYVFTIEGIGQALYETGYKASGRCTSA